MRSNNPHILTFTLNKQTDRQTLFKQHIYTFLQLKPDSVFLILMSGQARARGSPLSLFETTALRAQRSVGV